MARLSACFLFLVFWTSVTDAQSTSFPDALWSSDLIARAEMPLSSIMQGQHILLPDPPLQGSEEESYELSRLLMMQDTLRSQSRIAQIIEEHTAPDILDFLVSRGVIPFEIDAPVLWEVLRHGLYDIEIITIREKLRFNRPRPSQIQENIETAVPNPPHAAYPSGHASQAEFVSQVLRRLVPVCEYTYRRFASEIAFNREIAGVHYPSDSVAGFLLASRYTEILEQSEFWALYRDDARRELWLYVRSNTCAVNNGAED
ncbi:phosphatase PAP2 family protein [Roseibaca sp. V10]|uniref:Phosphatase PAP2 family protein n=1 Tax=Roseinatronobacter domitianus TaxID=2940293 RepID=A0ABT0M4F4_9RHOB|nr:phosphatase PAP2 family protein [Roseibaca domitiana]MCL1629528.1 phosphatase PAP2 family protein [Roseibaca domitiana]